MHDCSQAKCAARTPDSFQYRVYASDNGCNWGYTALMWAAVRGHIEILKWAHAQRPLPAQQIHQMYVCTKYRHVAQWLAEMGAVDVEGLWEKK